MSVKGAQLPDQPTLTEIQQYVAAKLKERNLEAGTQEYFLLLVEEVGELAKALRPTYGIKMASDAAAQNIEHEAADVLWLLISVCNSLNIDLEQALRSKELKNENRVWK